MFLFMYGFMYVWSYVCMYVSMHVFMCVCVLVCLYVNIYVYIYLIFYLYIQGAHFSRWLTQKKALNKVNIIYLTYGGTNSEYMSEVIIQKLMKRHVVLKDTDLVFIDYSMNDAGMLTYLMIVMMMMMMMMKNIVDDMLVLINFFITIMNLSIISLYKWSVRQWLQDRTRVGTIN